MGRFLTTASISLVVKGLFKLLIFSSVMSPKVYVFLQGSLPYCLSFQNYKYFVILSNNFHYSHNVDCCFFSLDLSCQTFGDFNTSIIDIDQGDLNQ